MSQDRAENKEEENVQRPTPNIEFRKESADRTAKKDRGAEFEQNNSYSRSGL